MILLIKFFNADMHFNDYKENKYVEPASMISIGNLGLLKHTSTVDKCSFQEHPLETGFLRFFDRG